MRRATVTIPDDLAAELDDYLSEQDAPPAFTTLVQAALREYLQNKRWRERDYCPPRGPFNIDPIRTEEIREDRRGETDVSINHDKYFAKP